MNFPYHFWFLHFLFNLFTQQFLIRVLDSQQDNLRLGRNKLNHNETKSTHGKTAKPTATQNKPTA